jgi:lipopolysaccharide transport system permease protein
MGHVVVDFLIRFLLLGIIFVIFKVLPSWLAVFLPLALLPFFLLTIGLGLFLALFSAIVRDISRFVALAFTFLIFICPVVYPIPKGGILAKLNLWNPLACLLDASRDIVFKGTITNPEGFFLSAALSVFIFFSGWLIFHIGQTKIAERI